MRFVLVAGLHVASAGTQAFAPQHALCFANCSLRDSVVDDAGELDASPYPGAVCERGAPSPEGFVLDGSRASNIELSPVAVHGPSSWMMWIKWAPSLNSSVGFQNLVEMSGVGYVESSVDPSGRYMVSSSNCWGIDALGTLVWFVDNCGAPQNRTDEEPGAHCHQDSNWLQAEVQTQTAAIRGGWTQVAGTVAGTTMKLYVNGALEAVQNSGLEPQSYGDMAERRVGFRPP